MAQNVAHVPLYPPGFQFEIDNKQIYIRQYLEVVKYTTRYGLVKDQVSYVESSK